MKIEYYNKSNTNFVECSLNSEIQILIPNKNFPYFILLTLLYSYFGRYVDSVELSHVSKLGGYLTGMTHT